MSRAHINSVIHIVGTPIGSDSSTVDIFPFDKSYIGIHGTTPTFTRASSATQLDGTSVSANNPRYETGLFGQALTFESPTANLLTATQSNVEADTTGFTAAHGATLTRTTDEHWQGEASLKVETPGSEIGEGLSISRSDFYVGDTITFSSYIKGSGTIRVYITDNEVGNNTPVNYTLTSSWQKITSTYTLQGTGSITPTCLISTPTTQVITFYCDGFQIEKKPYATSWIQGGSSRVAETLTIPAPDATEGTIECLVKPLRSPGTIEQYIFDAGGALNANMEVYINTDGTLGLRFGTGAATVTLTGTTVMAVDTWYRIAWKWSSAGASILVNGVSEDSDATAPGMTFGVNASWGKDIEVENIVTNGDFALDSDSDGLADDWVASQVASKSVASNTQSFTASAQFGRVSQALSFVVAHKYYARAKVKANTALCRLVVSGDVSASYDAHTGDSTYQVLSLVHTLTTDTKVSVYVGDYRASGFAQIDIQEVIAVDLTALFGAGNEPDATWCDANLVPWFDGTTTLYPRLDGLLDDVRVSSAARDDSEILRYHVSLSPFGINQEEGVCT